MGWHCGYLVTITNESEYNTVRSINNVTSWSGGTDSVSEGQWTWDAPDAYQVYSDFEVGLAGAVSYFDPGSQPDNSGNFMTVNFGTSNRYWDDSNDSSFAQIIEFSPIDTTVTFNITAGTALTATAPSTGLAATVDTSYSLASAELSGGTSPFTYSIASGTLPDGLTLNSSTGVISGSPPLPHSPAPSASQ